MQAHLHTHISGGCRAELGKERIFPMGRKTVEVKIGRDAETGQFKPVDEARRDRAGSVVETIKRPANTHK
jgi:hypothetical protein